MGMDELTATETSKSKGGDKVRKMSLETKVKLPVQMRDLLFSLNESCTKSLRRFKFLGLCQVNSR